MKNLFIILTVLGFTQFVFGNESHTVDEVSSIIKWTGTKVTGMHNGTIKIKSGKVTFDDNGVLVGAEFLVQMNTINVTNLSGEWKQKLEGHLKHADFFSVNSHKFAKFKLQKVISKTGNDYEVQGNLTIKGITKSVKLKVTVVQGQNPSISGKLVFDRTKFDIKYNSGSFFKGLGDKMISNDVALNFNVETK